MCKHFSQLLVVTWMSEIEYTVPRQLKLQKWRGIKVFNFIYTKMEQLFETVLGNVSISPEWVPYTCSHFQTCKSCPHLQTEPWQSHQELSSRNSSVPSPFWLLSPAHLQAATHFCLSKHQPFFTYQQEWLLAPVCKESILQDHSKPVWFS